MRSIRNQSIQTLFHRGHIFFITVHPQIAIGCSSQIHGTVYTFRNDKISVRTYKGSCNLSLIGIGSTSILKVKCNRFSRSISILFHPRRPTKENITILYRLFIVHRANIPILAHKIKILFTHNSSRKSCSVQIYRDNLSRHDICHSRNAFDFFNQRIIQWIVRQNRIQIILRISFIILSRIVKLQFELSMINGKTCFMLRVNISHIIRDNHKQCAGKPHCEDGTNGSFWITRHICHCHRKHGDIFSANSLSLFLCFCIF